MSPTTRARRVPRDDGLGVVEHLGHRDPDRRCRSRGSTSAERIADEEHRDAGLVEEHGRRVVVGREHRDPLAVGVQLGDVADGQAAGRARAWHSSRRSPRRTLGRPALPQSARPHRGRPAGRATRSSTRSATSRFVSSGRRSGSSAVEKMRPRSCRSRSPTRPRRRRWRRAGRRPLRRSLSAARSSEPVSAAKPTRSGRGSSGRRVAHPRCRARGRSGRPRPGGPASARARGSGRRRGRASCRPGGPAGSRPPPRP